MDDIFILYFLMEKQFLNKSFYKHISFIVELFDGKRTVSCSHIQACNLCVDTT